MNPFVYRAFDLLTWEPIDDLPFREVAFGKALDQHGTWQAAIHLADPNVQKMAWKDACQPSKVAMFTELNGVLVWGGILWAQPEYDSADPQHKLQVTANEFGSYTQHRTQAADYATLWEGGEDPMKIARRLLEDAFEAEAAEGAFSANHNYGHVTGAKIPVVLSPAAGSGQSISVSYPESSRQVIDSMLSTLMQMGWGVGFDMSWDCQYESGTRTPRVTANIYYPLKGRTAEESGIVVLGKEARLKYPVDGTNQANEVTETGSGTNGLEPETAESHIAGYPLLQKTTARTQITTSAPLAEIALGELALLEYPVCTPSLILPLPLPGTPAAKRSGLALGEFDVGDRLIYRIDAMSSATENVDPRFPEGMEFEWRVNSWSVQVADSGLSTLQLDLGPPPLSYVPAPAPPV